MGCGASVEGDSDSQDSQDEWSKAPGSRRRQRKQNRRKSNYSDNSEAYTVSTAASERTVTPSERKDAPPSLNRDTNTIRKDKTPQYKDEKVALVQDMIPYPAPAPEPAIFNIPNKQTTYEVPKEVDAGNLFNVKEIPNEIKSGELFTDPDFPPDESSLCHSYEPRGHTITWMRPHELVNDPQLLVDGVSRHDIVQGILADCWFLSSCAAVAQKPTLMEKVIPSNQRLYGNGYKGQIIFRFWRFGRWITVHVDDLLPTKKGNLVYSRSSEPKEFWVSLLEKAYAKLHGSYEALEGGQAMDALVDLTGGLAERYELESAPPHLYNFLLNGYRNGAFITCSRKGDWRTSFQTDISGLVPGHAYTISAVATVKLSTGSEANLIRIRNPWGNEMEWNGQWNDNDNSWKKLDGATKEDIEYGKRGDGEFWMSFQDFCREFEEVTICSLHPELRESGINEDGSHEDRIVASHSVSITGQWVLGKSAGGSRNNLMMFSTNPQFLLSISKPTAEGRLHHVVIAVMQLRRRCVRHAGRKMLQIGFVLYKVDEPVKQTLQNFVHNEELGNSGPYINYREVVGRFHLPTGYYVIVPATFEPNCPGSFLIRVFVNTDGTLTEGQRELQIGKKYDLRNNQKMLQHEVREVHLKHLKTFKSLLWKII